MRALPLCALFTSLLALFMARLQSPAALSSSVSALFSRLPVVRRAAYRPAAGPAAAPGSPAPATAAGTGAAMAPGAVQVRHIPASKLAVSKPTWWLESRFHFRCVPLESQRAWWEPGAALAARPAPAMPATRDACSTATPSPPSSTLAAQLC